MSIEQFRATNDMRILRRTPSPEASPLAAALPAVLARVYAARGVSSLADVDYSLEQLVAPRLLKGIGEAVKLLSEALARDARILIVADFDADGATSCAVAVRALRLMGARHVGYIVPNRFEFGYGLTPEIVSLAAQQQPDLILTVDNGISSIEGVAAARARGIAVLVTDHHLPGAVLPDANGIVNPNQPGCDFPSKHLAGVGVVFYLMLALRAYLRDSGWFSERDRAEPNLGQLLDLVALGTVADVVPLDRNNRILVAQGLARINQGRCQPGIKALLRVAGRGPGRLSTGDLGFCVAPRLNAAGRLDDMSLGIACLLADDEQAAHGMAQELDRLNRERRTIEAEMQQQAQAIVHSLHVDSTTGLPRGLCLFNEDWHQGVIGIVAGRLKERLHRPVIAFARASDRELKGSARSVAGVHIRDVLDAIAARQPTLLQKFGGHAMAAGLSLACEHLSAFQAAFDEEVCRHLSEEDLYGRIWSDGEIAAQDLRIDLAEALRRAGPWGQGFAEPVFDGHFEVLERRTVGEKHLKLALRHKEGGAPLDAIAFNHEAEQVPARGLISVVYRLDVNEYRGLRSLQLVVEHVVAIAHS
jgi:single-stranded-DNA-specific exonuclease